MEVASCSFEMSRLQALIWYIAVFVTLLVWVPLKLGYFLPHCCSTIRKSKTEYFQQQTESKDLKQKHYEDENLSFFKTFHILSVKRVWSPRNFSGMNPNHSMCLLVITECFCHVRSLPACSNSWKFRKATLPQVLPSVEVIITDGSALVNATPPWTSKTFEEHASKEFASKIQSYAPTYLRTDIVFDVCRYCSLKAETRSKRGIGARRRVTASGTPPPPPPELAKFYKR